MKTLRSWALLLVLFFCGYSYPGLSAKVAEIENKKAAISLNNEDKAAIQQLIRQVLKWADEDISLDLFPVLKNNSGDLYKGFDLDQCEQNLEKLKSTNFFSKEFLDNYSKIYRALDQKLRKKEIEWYVGELPPFGNDADPWCNCQDVPYDEPSPWESIEVDVISLDKEKGELSWRWGELDPNAGEGWNEFTYKFRVVKEGGVWKISYLEGFDKEALCKIF